MLEFVMDYPKHLSEKIRKEIATSYLKHELKKIFPSINKSEIENLMNNKELCFPRDFWNGLHGISMGFKLKNILSLVTAENILWKKKIMRVDKLSFGVEMKLMNLEEIVALRGNNVERENDPIIAVEKSINNKKIIKVHDGNGRLARHHAEKKPIIEVYLGKMDGAYPYNFWLPTSLIIDNLYFIYEAIDSKNMELVNQQIACLKNILNKSESGKIEFLERALTKKEPYRSIILEQLGDLTTTNN
jgi:hypothetical protein